ncbi:flagellar hook-length control protein FliK [Glaciecola sp. KUL10]|uniref:flagellar hook-length control protein FliK n=1 Tax=Glaciecola sp. (strain KUL10) TaxID=2161813 RepID=UPI000D782A41|nr:flagellar hook-length control protein FliK [Glaciecola sp. KUL10]GBL04042.1 Flagellar hook-length control protein FliK [Glaciecola sp. KUL10]
MMQHIAALKPELNAQLPIDDFKISTGLTNDDPSLRQTFEQRSAFEDAMEQARQRQESKANEQTEIERNRQHHETKQREQAELEENRALEQRRDVHDKQSKQESLRAEERKKAYEESQARIAEQKERAEQSVKDNDNDNRNEKVSDVNEDANAKPKDHDDASSDRKLESADTRNETRDSEDKNDFDWVEYVNQVRLLDSKDEAIVDIDGLESKLSSYDLFTQFIEDQKLTEEGTQSAKIEGIDEIVEKLPVDMQEEFVTVHLNRDELVAIFELEGLSIDSNITIDAEKLEALDNAVAKILERFISSEQESNEATNETENSVNKDTELALDSDLLKTLIANKKSDELDGKSAISLDDKATGVEKEPVIKVGPTDAENVAVKQDATQTVNDKKKPLVDGEQSINASQNQELKLGEGKQAKESEKEVLVNNDELSPVQTLGGTNGLSNRDNDVLAREEIRLAGRAQAVESISPDLKADKVVELPKKTNGSKALALLGNLPEDKLKSALENINKRVSEVVTELKAEGKGTEFIAALQAGVKEVKEQLKQGREPGIDLKALVSDALAKTEVSAVQPQAEVKLERQVTQVANILGVASSLSQATTQAVSATIGLNEVNLQKEVNQAQVENAKQLNQQANNDKAFNILKPDGQTQLAEKVRWMVNNRSLTAEIRLDPPDLGGMQIKVAMSGDAASVNFVVQSQHARDVLDQAAPQLRDMLEEQGISLGESSVQQDSGNNQQELAENENLGTGGANIINSDDNESQNNDLAEQNVLSEQRIVNGRIGGIDHYA